MPQLSFLSNFGVLRRNANFRYLYIGQFVSLFGTMITTVALPYQIYHETHSTLMVGLLSFFQLMPVLFTALLGGAFSDRYQRRAILFTAEIILACGCLLLALNAYKAETSVLAIFVISSFMAAFNGLHRPAYDGMNQQLVARKDYPAMGALATFKYSVCLIIGPAVGGLIISSYGIIVTFLIDFMTFLISLLMLLCMQDIPKPTAKRDDSTWSAVKSGFKYAFSRQELVGSYLVDFTAMVFGMPNALFPAIAHNYGGAKTLGMLYAAPAVGALSISFFSGFVGNIKRHGAAIAISAMLWGITIIGFGLAPNLYIALFFLGLSGALDAISGIFRSIMWNETIPTEFRGRLAGIEMISYLSGPRLGDTEAGFVAAIFGVTTAVVSGGVLCVFGVALCCYCLPRFWKYHSVGAE